MHGTQEEIRKPRKKAQDVAMLPDRVLHALQSKWKPAKAPKLEASRTALQISQLVGFRPASVRT
jgi:hypothetical protein